MMRNRTSSTAIGGTIFFSISDQFTANTGALLGLKPRFRRWIGRATSLDLAAGPFLIFSDRPNAHTVGLTGQLGFHFGDWAGLTTQVLIGRSPFEAPTEFGFYLGGKLDSYPGGIVGVPLFVLWVFAAFGTFGG